MTICSLLQWHHNFLITTTAAAIAATTTGAEVNASSITLFGETNDSLCR